MTRKKIIFTIVVGFSLIAIISATIVSNRIKQAIYIKTVNANVDLMYDGFTQSTKISINSFSTI